MKKIKTLSLFSGAGGLDIGFHNANFDIVACVEINPAYSKTLQKNKEIGKYFSTSTVVHCEDIRKFDPTPYVEAGVECIIGGPPCQTFSAAGRRAGGVLGTSDARGQLFMAYCRLLRVLKPKVFVFENVYGLPGANDGGPWREIVEAFSSCGYHLSTEVLDAADYGVPQHRERLFIIGTQKGLPIFRFPRPTHGPDSDSGLDLISVRQALEGLKQDLKTQEPLGGLYGHLLEEVPEGLNYSFFTREMGHPEPQFAWRSKFHDFLYKVNSNEPCRTIKAQPGKFTGPFHWENRHFTIEELKRLQSFPDDYEMVGTYGKVVEQIGNSVAPSLAYAVAVSVREQIFEGLLSGLSFPGRPVGFKSTFRQRQRERTKSFKDIAAQVIRHRYPNVGAPGDNAISVFEKRNFAVVDRFSLKEIEDVATTRSLGEPRFLTIYEQKGEYAVLTVNEDCGVKDTVEVSIKIEGLSKYLSHLDEITIEAKIGNLSEVFSVWQIIQQVLVSKSRFFTLIDIYGHYANRGDTVKIWTQYSGVRKGEIIKALEFFGCSSNCGLLIGWKTAAEAIGVTEAKLKLMVEDLRSLRFDVRSSQSHVTIREDGVLCTYPFPMLSQKAHFDSAITPWVA